MTEDKKTIQLLQGMMQATPEQRAEFWKNLAQWSQANSLYPGFYCPYIPLQIYREKKDDN